MTLRVSLAHPLADFRLDARLEAPGGITVLFGPSGSGKTSIVNAVAGLLRPEQGHVAVGDRVLFDSAAGIFVPPHRRRLGYVFQEARLFPHLSVRQNLLYGTRFAPRGARGESLGRVVDILGIGHLLQRRPGALSGGETQRVAIGRALLSRPDMLLADEPLAALDDARREEIIPYFERLRDDLDVPILYVSHNVSEVARLATTVVLMEGGRTLRAGPAAEVLSDPRLLPTGPRDAGALLTARVRTHHPDGLTELDAGGHAIFLPRIAAAPGRTVRVRIAASDVILSRRRPEGLSALNILPGKVLRIEAGHGPGAMVAVETAAGRLLARITARSAAALQLAEGVDVHAVVKTVSVSRSDIGGTAAGQGEGP